jgi:SAM-dependent methyltransferase
VNDIRHASNLYSTTDSLLEDVACDLCGSRDHERRFRDGGFWIVRCCECDLFYVNPRPNVALQTANVAYGNHFGDAVISAPDHLAGELVIVSEMRWWLDELGRRAPKGRFLDIGCGTGTLLVEAARQGWQPIGIELNQARADLAEQRVNGPIHRQPIEILQLERESFAVISLVNVFSHLTAPAKTFRILGTLLQPGGVLFVKTGVLGRDTRKEHSRDWSVPDHLYFNGPNTLDRYLALAGTESIWCDERPVAAETYQRSAFEMPGRSRLRNLIKRVVLAIPGAHWSLFQFMVKVRHRDNPCRTGVVMGRKKL